MIWIHKHWEEGRDIWTLGEDFPDCEKDRGCWVEVTEEAAEWWLSRNRDNAENPQP